MRMAARNTRGRWLAIAGLVLLAVTAALVFRGSVGRHLDDFEVYRTAGIRALAGENLYRVEDRHWQFKYLPAFAILIAPIAALPVMAARGVWFFSSVALLVVLLNRAYHLLPDRRRAAGFLVGLTILALGKFYVREIGLGQSNLLLAVIVLFAVAALKDRREGTAGVLLGLATVVKPYAVLFLPYLAGRRRLRAVVACLATLAAAVLLPAVRYGFHGNVVLLAGWWNTVTTSIAPNVTNQDNISFAAMFAKWLGPGTAASVVTLGASAAALVICGVILVRKTAAPSPEYLDAAVLLMLIPLLSPQGWDYVLLVSTPAVMLLLDRLDEFRAPFRVLLAACLALAGLTFWDLMGRDLYRAFMMASAVSFCALVEVGMVLQLRLRRLA
jgi:hypothetical protein